MKIEDMIVGNKIFEITGDKTFYVGMIESTDNVHANIRWKNESNLYNHSKNYLTADYFKVIKKD